MSDETGLGGRVMAGVPLWRCVLGSVTRWYEWSTEAMVEARAGRTPGTWYPTDGDAPAREVAGELRDALQKTQDLLAELLGGGLISGDFDLLAVDEILFDNAPLLERAREGGDG